MSQKRKRRAVKRQKKYNWHQLEWGMKNYLNLHNIHKGDEGMQTIIINSFFNQRGGDNEEDWKVKLFYVHNHFGLFCQYAHNNWKQKQ